MVDEGLPIPRQRDLKGRASEEFKRFIVIFLYLWIVFGLLSLHTSLVLSQRHLNYQEHTLAIINAFVFAKVLLTGEHLHFGTRFSHKPLIYPILHKCFVFTVLLISFHIVESVVVGIWHGDTIRTSIPPMLGWNPKGVASSGRHLLRVAVAVFWIQRDCTSDGPQGDVGSPIWSKGSRQPGRRTNGRKTELESFAHANAPSEMSLLHTKSVRGLLLSTMTVVGSALKDKNAIECACYG